MNRKTKWSHRLLALALAAVMCCSVFPVGAFAETPLPQESTVATEEQQTDETETDSGQTDASSPDPGAATAEIAAPTTDEPAEEKEPYAFDGDVLYQDIRKTGEVLAGWKTEVGALDPWMTGEAEDGNFVYETRPLASAEYTITAAEDIYTQDRQTDNYGNRTLWYAKGDVVAVVTTGDGSADIAAFAPARTKATYDFLSVIHDGTIGEVSVTLPLGSYHIEETKPPYGYIGTPESYDVTFAWDNERNDVVMATSIAKVDGAASSQSFEVVRSKDANADFTEQQTLKFYNDREKAKVGIYKTDLESGKYLAGAVFNLYTADDIYDADGSLVFAAGELVATSPETNADGTTYFDCDIPIRGEQYGSSTHKDAATNSGKYIIEEIRAPLGYYVNEEPMEVTFTYDGQTVRILESTCTDKPTEMWVSKRDLTNDEELPGATLTIQDMDGNIVESWVSTDTPHLKTDEDAMKLAYALVFNTKKNPAASGGENEFWDKSAVMFLASLILYILYESPLYERNLNTMMDMILECKVSEDSYDENRMDILFGELEQRDPHHPAVLQYRSFKLGSAKTLSSIMVTAVSNLHMLQSAAFAEMIATDEMFLPKLGVEKRAIFCVIPDNDDTFNFMVSILYTQLFDQLFRLADSTPEFHGTLPVHVRLMMDEFANVATPENFVKILAVARSRNISCDIILQNISQIKSKYKDDWETIIGNCDSLVYLGGNDYSTFEYISKLLGKQTIRTKGQSIGKGSHGSSSDSYQVTGRELMTPDEVRRMKRSDCLVMISGEAPVRDKRYNLFDHPNLKYTPDYRSPRGLLHRFATPIPAPEGYTMPPDYMAQAGTVSLAYVAELTCPEITEDLYDELQELEESLL